MKKKKGWLIALAVVLVVAVLLLLANKILADDLFGRFGSMLKSVNPDLAPAQETVVATIDGEPYYCDTLDYMEKVYNLSGNAKSKEEIIRRLVENELLYRDAHEHGVSLSEEEFSTALEQIQTSLHQDEQTYQDILSFCESFGITEEEYWQVSAPEYDKFWTINKYQISLRDEYFAENENATQEEFKAYLENYKQSIWQAHNVTLL